jgi:class 3 adenylate cyclase/YHS domain-containing protein
MAEDADTFLFVDMAGFTALTEAHGDEGAAELAADFFAHVRRLLPEHDAEEIKTIGDAVLVRCRKAGAAVELALRLVEEVGKRPGFPILRAGMHTGPAVERGGDWFGATVNLAARISGLAGGGEVLLTKATRDAAAPLPDVEFRGRGAQRFRHVNRPVEVFRAARTGAEAAGLPIDPVCRMAVDPGRGAGALTYRGVEHHFCSLECARAFAAAPDEYA